jgi:hypothetical protein
MAGKHKQMSTPQKEVVISLFEDGVSQRWIAEILGVNQSGVSKFLKRFNQRESCENERRSGLPRKTDDCCDRKILALCENGHDKVWRKLQPKWIMSCQTRFLQGLFVDDYDSMGSEGDKFVRLTIRTENRHRHVHWCRSKLRWTLNRDWKRVIFSDETQVMVDSTNCVYVWRRPDEVWWPECLGLRGNWKFSAMFWGCITYQGVGTFTEVEGNINSNLFTTTFSPYLLHFFTVNYALRLNLTILRLNKHRFFKIRLYRKGHTVIDHTER